MTYNENIACTRDSFENATMGSVNKYVCRHYTAVARLKPSPRSSTNNNYCEYVNDEK